MSHCTQFIFQSKQKFPARLHGDCLFWYWPCVGSHICVCIICVCHSVSLKQLKKRSVDYSHTYSSDEDYVLTNVGFGHIAWIFAISYTTGAFLGSTFSGLSLVLFGLQNSTVLFIFPLALSVSIKLDPVVSPQGN